MTFHNVRLPTSVEQGAVGGPAFKTTILPLVSGHEKRNRDWSKSRGRWDISYGIRTLADVSLISAFFRARAGRAYSFRFKDWADYTATAQQFGTGDGSTTAFQLTKTYGDAGGSYVRDITKPVSGTLSITVNASPLTEGVGYTVNYSTGVVTFTSPPTSTHAIVWSGEFDTHVRFDTDALAVTIATAEAGSIPSIPIIEVRS